jgi:hypothetical protein
LDQLLLKNNDKLNVLSESKKLILDDAYIRRVRKLRKLLTPIANAIVALQAEDSNLSDVAMQFELIRCSLFDPLISQ